MLGIGALIREEKTLVRICRSEVCSSGWSNSSGDGCSGCCSGSSRERGSDVEGSGGGNGGVVGLGCKRG